MAWTLTTQGLRETTQRFELASGLLPQRIAQVFQARLAEAVTYARATYLTGGTTGTRLATRTGRFAEAFTQTVTQTGDTVTGRLGYLQGPSWATTHEFGATIRAKNVRYLAIPLTAEARAAGSPRQIPDLFARQSRAGNLLLFRRLEGGRLEPLYLLRTEVVIPPRPALQPTVDRFRPLIVNDLRQAVTQTLRG